MICLLWPMKQKKIVTEKKIPTPQKKSLIGWPMLQLKEAVGSGAVY